MSKVELPVAVDAYSRELRLLLALVGLDNNPSLPSELLDSTPHWDWDDFLRLVVHHRVYPAVYLSLKRLSHPAIPPSVMQALFAEYRRNSFMMLQLCGELQRVGQCFEQQGIRFFVLKGPVLAEALYGDLSMRTSKDLDMLVSPTDMERADHLLQSCGYEQSVAEPTPFIFRLRKDPGRDYHKSYIHPGNKVQIELHWRMNGRSDREPAFDELWEHRRLLSLAPASIAYLGQEHMCFSLVTHGSRHGWFRLRWLADMDRLFRQQRDHDQLMRILQVYKVGHYGEQAMVLCEQLLCTNLSDVRNQPPSGYVLRIVRSAMDVIGGASDVRYKLLLKRPLQKVVYVLGMLLPRRLDWETLPLPKPLHILYIPLRPVLWLWRMRKKQSQAAALTGSARNTVKDGMNASHTEEQ